MRVSVCTTDLSKGMPARSVFVFVYGRTVSYRGSALRQHLLVDVEESSGEVVGQDRAVRRAGKHLLHRCR